MKKLCRRLEAEAQCVDCGHRWWVGADGTGAGYMPACPKCRSFGVSTGRSRRRPSPKARTR